MVYTTPPKKITRKMTQNKSVIKKKQYKITVYRI